MEIQQNLVRLPTRPIVIVLAVLAVLAVALTAFYVLRSSGPSQNLGTDRPAVTACTGMVPDAQERCERIMAAQQSKAEATHGH